MQNETWNVCLDCSEEMVVDEKASELVCQSCGVVKRFVGIAFNEAKLFSQEGQNRKPSRSDKSDTYLRRVLKKYKIFDAVNTVIYEGKEQYNPEMYHLLGNLVYQFHGANKSVNFACFRYAFFQSDFSERWPRKQEILDFFLPTSQTRQKLTRHAKERFDAWYEEITNESRMEDY